MTVVPADLRRERRYPNNSVDMLQLALDSLREYERKTEVFAQRGNDLGAEYDRDLAALRFQLASAIEQRRCNVALERIALAVETIARQELGA